ncbi:MAG: insulinase family protein [Bacteroidia bacterium]|nr:insulinase family protein [Bacteroidia bacterium]
MFETHTFTLANGIRVIHLQTKTDVAHCGLYINTGTRDELWHEHGIAHFIEHCVFKGTHSRKAYHILSRMENVGGEINAYTGKEETCYYASFLKQHYARAIELLCDITFFATFPEKEIEKEKTVVIDEIHSYLDSPSEEIYDRFEEFIYPGHTLGNDILGTPARLKSFQKADLLNFTTRAYNTDQMVFSSVGNISPVQLRKLLNNTLASIPENNRNFSRNTPEPYSPFYKSIKRRTNQSHLVVGNRAYSIRDEQRTGLILLNNLLGGPGMSSRLNLSIREKYGYTYNIDSSYALYSDSGVWSVYMGTENAWIDRCRELLTKELRKLREDLLGAAQLHKAKQQLIGQIAIAQESNVSIMLGFAKTFLLFNKVESFAEIEAKIEALDAHLLRDIAAEVFNENNLSSLVYPANTKAG